MDKNDFILKVQPLTDLFDNADSIGTDTDWVRELYNEDGYRTAVTAWDVNGEYMIDDHITGYYPELETLGIEELAEGDMYTKLNGAPAIVSALRRMGFQAELVGDSNQSEPIVREPSVEELEQQMYGHVEREEYEQAAKLRDRIRNILRRERDES